jgi:DNA-binding transcriptional MerR regulator
MPNRPSTALHYPIRAVARMTGLSVDTLRAWERRYDAVVPRRSGRGRVYTDADVARLRLLGGLVKCGHAIGTVAGLSDAELGRLLKGTEAHTDREAPVGVAPLEPLMDALDLYDLGRIETTLNRHALVLPPRELVFGVVVPLLQEVGRRWEDGRLRPAQEHLVSAIVRSVLGGVLRAIARPDRSPRIVFATPSGERHELGLLCAALLAASAGYGVVYLGPDLPAEDIEHAAQQARARVILVSLTTPGVVSRAKLKRLGRPPQGVELWVGGPEAHALLPLVAERGRAIESLAAVIPMLSSHLH